MPNQTFFNLEEKKRKRITEAALDEFSTNDYNSASINTIIKNADIPKGSMYQYFNNKKDLYLYLVDLASEAKLGYISNKIGEGDYTNFFQTLKQMHLTGLKFELNNPRLSRLLFNAASETSEEISNISKEMFSRSDKYFEDFITRARENGEIRDDINLKFISFIISRVSLSIADYVSYKFDFSYEEVIRKGKGKIPVNYNELEKILDDMTSILKEGMKKE